MTEPARPGASRRQVPRREEAPRSEQLGGADARQGLGEVGERGRLPQDVGHAQFPGGLDLPLGHRPREQDDRQVGARRADPPQDLQAIDPGHDDVEEHRVGRALLDDPETFFSAAGDLGLVTFALEDLGDNVRYIRLIIDDEDSHDSPTIWNRWSPRQGRDSPLRTRESAREPRPGRIRGGNSSREAFPRRRGAAFEWVPPVNARPAVEFCHCGYVWKSG